MEVYLLKMVIFHGYEWRTVSHNQKITPINKPNKSIRSFLDPLNSTKFSCQASGVGSLPRALSVRPPVHPWRLPPSAGVNQVCRKKKGRTGRTGQNWICLKNISGWWLGILIPSTIFVHILGRIIPIYGKMFQTTKQIFFSIRSIRLAPCYVENAADKCWQDKLEGPFFRSCPWRYRRTTSGCVQASDLSANSYRN